MRTKILEASPQNIQTVAESIRKGEIAAMPTETVYGLAGNALDPIALARIFDAKKRPTFDPLILHIAQGFSLEEVVEIEALSEIARARVHDLIARFWPGPLTLVLPKKQIVPDLATAGLPGVAVRMPSHPVAQALLQAANVPLAAPSANRFGRISPTRAEHVLEELQGRIQWILDGGECEIGLESTVIEIRADGSPFLLRPGGIPSAQIENALGLKLSSGESGEKRGAAITGAVPAPGMLENHYAPERPLHLLNQSVEKTDDETLGKILRAHLAYPAHTGRLVSHLGVLLFSGSARRVEVGLSARLGLPVSAISLSENGNIAEAARNLFSALRELDKSGADVLIAEPCPAHEGLGYAITDRLIRASQKPGRVLTPQA